MAVHWGGRGPRHASRLARAGTATPTPTPTPPPTILKVVTEGDSITAYEQYQATAIAAYPDVEFVSVGIGGGNIGTPANEGDNSNTGWGRINQVKAEDPDIVTVLFGANGIGASFLDDMYAYAAALRAWKPSVLVMFGTVLPAAVYGSGGEVTRQATNDDYRANVGVKFDAIIPFGDHPVTGSEEGGEDTSLYPDGLHPTGCWPQMREVFAAVVGSAIEQRTGTTPHDFAFIDQSNVALGSTHTALTTVSGLGLNVAATASMSGAGTIRKSYLADGTSPLSVRNGDVITSTVVAGEEDYETAVDQTLTIGGVSDTFTVTTQVEPGAEADLASDGYKAIGAHQSDGFDPFVFEDASFPAGRPVVAVAGDYTTTGVTVNGAACRQVVSNTGNRNVWMGPNELTAGNYDVVVTRNQCRDCSIYTAAATGLSDNVETGNSVYPLTYWFDGDYEGDNPLTLNAGGMVINFALIGAGAINDVYGDTVVSDNGVDAGGPLGGCRTYWIKSTKNGKPKFHTTATTITCMMAASFDP